MRVVVSKAVLVLSCIPAGLASWCWVFAGKGNVPAFEDYVMGDSLYALGYPLTLLVLKFPDYAGRRFTEADHWWAVPILVILFLAQWQLWALLWKLTGGQLIRRWKKA